MEAKECEESVRCWCPKSSFLFHNETCSKVAWDLTMSFSSTCSCFLAATEKQSWSNKWYNCRQEAATSSSSLSLSTCYFNIISFFVLWVSLWLIFSWMFLNDIQWYLSKFRLFDISMGHVRDKGDHIIIHCSFKVSKKVGNRKEIIVSLIPILVYNMVSVTGIRVSSNWVLQFFNIAFVTF